MLRFDQPLWLGIGVGCCVLLWVLFRFLERRRSSRLRRFVAPALISELTLHISADKRRIKESLAVVVVFLCFVALARPQYGYRWVDVTRKGIDILFAVDTSKSMLAEDIRPNRLERSKLAIMDFVSDLSGDRVGLLPFAGTAFLICPLTSDYRTFEQTLLSLDQNTIPDGGTDIDSAIDTALATLSNDANHKFLVLISDGELLQGDAAAAARRAVEHDMIVHTVGVGSLEGELIPDPESGGFVRDNQGEFVKSRLDQKSLDTIADITGGLSVLLGSKGQGLTTVYQEKLALVPPVELAEKRTRVPVERFGWPLGLAIVLLSIELLLPERKNGLGSPGFLSLLTRRRITKNRLPLALLMLLPALVSEPSSLYSAEAQELYDAGNYAEAQKRYHTLLEDRPADPRLLFNNGAAAYKNSDFEVAARNFEKALATDDLQLQEKTYYNRGNALFRLGERQQQDDPGDPGQADRVIDAWEQALRSFDNALALNPENDQARANGTFVKAKLEELKKEQRSRKNDSDQSEQGASGEQRTQSAQEKGEADEISGQQKKQQEQSENHEKNHSDEQEQQDRGSTRSEQSSPDATGPEPGGGPETIAPGARNQQTDPGDNAAGSDAAPEMSGEEAEQLLQSLNSEEGWMSIAAPSRNERKSADQDW